ncbi:MAG: hypothetical protein RLZZ461_1552, partial [Planctomycetota bacterium]
PEGTISPEDPDRLVITDDPDEVVKLVTHTARSRFGLTYGPRMAPRRYLFERSLFERR